MKPSHRATVLFLASCLALVAPGARAQTAAGVAFVPQVGHGASVVGAAATADGRAVISAAEDGSLRIWDRATGVVLRALDRPAAKIVGFALSRDDKRILTVTPQSVELTDLTTGSPAGRVRLPGEILTSGALLPDGARAVVGTVDGRVLLLDVSAGKKLGDWKGHKGKVRAVAVSPDGARIASGGVDTLVRVLSLPDGKLERTFRNAQRIRGVGSTPVLAVHFSPDGSLLAAGTEGTVEAGGAFVNVWSVKSGAVQATGGLGFPVRVVQFVGGAAGAPLRLAFGNSTQLAALDPSKPKEEPSIDDVGADLVTALPDGKGYLKVNDKRIDLASSDGVLERTFEGRQTTREHASASADVRRAVTIHGASASVWDLGALEVRDSFVAPGPVDTLALSRDGKRAFLTFETRGSLRDLEGAAPGAPISLGMRVQAATFSPDGSEIAVAGVRDKEGGAGVLRVPDLSSRTKVSYPLTGARRGGSSGDGDSGSERVNAVALAGDKNRLVIASAAKFGSAFDGLIRAFDLGTGKLIEGFPTNAFGVALSSDGGRALDPSLTTWDLAAGHLDHTVGGDILGTAVAFANGDKSAVLGLYGGDVVRVDRVSGTLEGRIAGRTTWPKKVFASTDGRYVLVEHADGVHRLGRFDTGASVSLMANGSEWLIYDERGYFDASRGGAALAKAVRGLSAFGVEQLAIRNNRPDLLLERMGLGEPARIAFYRARYERRLKRLGLTASDLDQSFDAAPTLAIKSAAAQGKDGVVSFDARSAGASPGVVGNDAELKRLIVRVNGVPIAGAAGKPLSGKQVRGEERFPLIAGPNAIEVSVVDAHGVESLRETATLEGPPAAKRRIHYLGFGVSRYRDARLNLRFAHKDALDLAHYVRSLAQKGPYGDVVVHTYVNEQVTRETIARAKEDLKSADVNDVVVVFVAGHGTYGKGADAPYYFVTHDTDVKRLEQTAAPFELLEELVDGIAPRAKLLLLDTCQSGERDEEATVEKLAADAGAAPAPKAAPKVTTRRARALELELDTASEARAPARPWLFERSRFITNDLTRRTGAVVLSSSTGSESSYESEGDQNGTFTRELLLLFTSAAAAKDAVTLQDLRSRLPAAVAERTGGLQHPVVDRDNLATRISFPRLPGLVFPKVEPVEAGGEGEARAVPAKVVRVPPRAGGCGCDVGPRDAGAPALALALAAAVALALRGRARAR